MSSKLELESPTLFHKVILRFLTIALPICIIFGYYRSSSLRENDIYGFEMKFYGLVLAVLNGEEVIFPKESAYSFDDVVDRLETLGKITSKEAEEAREAIIVVRKP